MAWRGWAWHGMEHGLSRRTPWRAGERCGQTSARALVASEERTARCCHKTSKTPCRWALNTGKAQRFLTLRLLVTWY